MIDSNIHIHKTKINLTIKSCNTNTIIRKNKKKSESSDREKSKSSDHEKSKSSDHEKSKSSDREKLPISEEEEIVISDMPTVNITDIQTEFKTEFKKDSKTSEIISEEQSKEDVLESIEDERQRLINNKNQYLPRDFSAKLATIDHLLSDMKRNMANMCLSNMNDIRKKIDQIVLKNRIPEKQFKNKIDLTGNIKDKDDKDPSTVTINTGHRYYDKNGGYSITPSHLQKKDPSRNPKINFGNKPIPNELLKIINYQ